MAETNPTTSYFYKFKERNPQLFDTQADRERTEKQQDLASMQQSLEIPVSTSSDLRRDGTKKSMRGYLGPIKSNIEEGTFHTELSTYFDDVLDGREIPFLVPTLTEEEVDWFRNNEGIPPQSIRDKAIEHAIERDKQGLSPFYQDGEKEVRSSEDEQVAVLNSIREQDIAPNYRSRLTSIQNKLKRQRQINTQSLKDGYTLDDLNENDEFQARSARFLSTLGDNTDIFEYLRDTNWNTTQAIATAIRSGKWDEQQKEDFNYLRSTFDNAKFGGLGQMVEATKDIAVDFVLDPVNLVSLPFIVGTGGLAAIGARAVSKYASSKALRTGALKLSQNGTFRAVSMGLTEGAYDASLHNMATQVTDIQTGIRQNYSPVETLAATGIGATAGAGLSYGFVKGANWLNRRKNRNVNFDETDIPEFKSKDEVVKFSRNNQRANKAISLVTGKATTPFMEFAKSKPKLKQLVELIRYDGMREIFNRNPITKKDFAERADSGRTMLQEYFHLSKSINESRYRAEVGDIFTNLYAKKGSLSLAIKPEDNKAIVDMMINADSIPFEQLLRSPKKVIEVPNVGKLPRNVVQAGKQAVDFINKVHKDATSLRKIEKPGEVISLFGSYKPIKNYFPRNWNYDVIIEKQDILEEGLIRNGLADPRNERLTMEGFEKLAIEDGQAFPDTIPTQFIRKGEPTVDQRLYSKYLEGSQSFDELATKTGKTAQELKANAIVREIINRKNQAYDPISSKKLGVTSSNSYIKHRAFGDLPDSFLIENDFIDYDVEKILLNYASDMAVDIQRARYFGRDSDEFGERWLVPIQKEFDEAGELDVYQDEIKDQMTRLYEVVTGLKPYLPPNKLAANAKDGIQLTQQLAHLGFATLSSITEPLIALARVNFADTDIYTKAYAKAGGSWAKNTLSKNFARLRNMTGADTKIYKDTDTMRDAYQFAVALEHAALDRIAGMYGEGMDTGVAKHISNGFFNVIALQPWTQVVTLGSFNLAKKKITRSLGELATNKNAYGISLTARQRRTRVEELFEIGVDYRNGVKAYNAAVDKDGIFQESLFKNQKFYETEVSPASSLFASEIILNPSASAANKPLWFNQWWAQIAVQFAGYPTAFTNTVLKGMVRNVVRNPVSNTLKTMSAVGLLTGTAIITNALRSEGRSITEAESPEQIVVDAVERWGGLGPAQYPYRMYEATKYGGGTLGPVIKGSAGPFVADLVDGIAYQQNIPEIAVQNLPFYSTIPKEWRDAMRKSARDLTKDPERVRSTFEKGGKVEIPRAAREPDERIDKLTGLPYDRQAGTAYIDVEDRSERLPFQEGGDMNTEQDIVDVLNADPDYRYFYREIGDWELEDNDPIELYTDSKDFPDLDIKKDFYIGLASNTINAKLNSINKSTEIGLKVFEDKGDVLNTVPLRGKIKFKKLLELDIDSSRPLDIQDALEDMASKDILIDKKLGEEIIKSKRNDLDATVDKQENDRMTPAKLKILQRSRSFYVRDELLKLGYDAIKTNEGYTLLRHNQFLPTEIVKGRGVRNSTRRRNNVEDREPIRFGKNENDRLPRDRMSPGGEFEGDKIDYSFIGESEGFETTAYVPKDSTGTVFGKSGVTVANGFDLGQRNLNDLQGLPPELIKKFTPYLGKQTEEAKQYLQENPFTLSDEEAETVRNFAHKQETNKVVTAYQTKTGKNFYDLPAAAQTVIADVAYQHGAEASVNYKNWGGLIKELSDNPKNPEIYRRMQDELLNFTSQTDDSGKMLYFNRREREAKLLDNYAKGLF